MRIFRASSQALSPENAPSRCHDGRLEVSGRRSSCQSIQAAVMQRHIILRSIVYAPQLLYSLAMSASEMLSPWVLFRALLYRMTTDTPCQGSRERCLGRIIIPVGQLGSGKRITEVCLIARDAVLSSHHRPIQLVVWSTDRPRARMFFPMPRAYGIAQGPSDAAQKHFTCTMPPFAR
jgi:hypothetical protein